MWFLVQEPGPDLKVNSAQILHQSQVGIKKCKGLSYRFNINLLLEQMGVIAREYLQSWSN